MTLANDKSAGRVRRPALLRLSYAFVFIVSATAIVFAARGDLWLDEIWSLSFAGRSRSVADVFRLFHHDNNHPLNTLFLYLLGNQRILLTYRLLAVLSGLGALLLAGYVAGRDWGAVEGLSGMALIGMSYPLLLYFSEARGYAPAVFFGLAAYAVLGHPPRRHGWARPVLFWLVSVAGILAHSTFAILTLAFALWGVAQELELKSLFGQATRRLLVLHAPPSLFLAFWYVYFLKDMTIGGGPEYGVWTVLGQASVLLLGLPDTSLLRAAAPIVALILVTLGSFSLFRQRDKRWSFFPAAIVVAPALMLLATSPRYLYFRYFCVCFPFFLLLIAHLVGRCQRSLPKRFIWAAFALVVALLAAQFPRDYLLLKLGRGRYASALTFIAAQSSTLGVRVGTDHDFRNRVLFDFYAPRAVRPGSLRYVDKSKWREEPPDWIIMHNQDAGYRPPKAFTAQGVGEYRFVNQYGFSGVSGWSWFLFRKVTREPA